jgi:hypothetical protein
MEFIGQKQQDRWVIEEVFRFRRSGFFVDLAATNGVQFNNTLLLERELGWAGIAIEADPSYFAELSVNRRCVCVQACVDEVERMVEFLSNAELGGIVDVDTDNTRGIRGELIDQWTAEGRVLTDLPPSG